MHCEAVKMEGIKTFLESSTIHGLSYISTTRKTTRCLWMLVVMTGFTGAGLLIYESFNAWKQSPIMTSIETLPISEVTLPKVTVCPPKNTYTDLNYDIMMSSNMSMNDIEKKEMMKLVEDLADENFYNLVMERLEMLQEERRFYNWYHQYTEMRIPPKSYKLNYQIDTSAIHGNITTHFFGKKFQQNLVAKKAYYSIYVYIPQSVLQDKNMTLHFKMERVPVLNLEYGYEFLYLQDEIYDVDQTRVHKIVRPSSDYTDTYGIITETKVSVKELSMMEMKLMPGFHLSWYYDGGKVTPELYKNINYDEGKKTRLKYLIR